MTDLSPALRHGRPTIKGRQTLPAALADVEDALADGLGGHPPRRENLIEYLHVLQDTFGHISADHVAALARLMKLGQAEVYKTATFYAHFDVLADGEDAPPPLTVRVCDGISCAMAGADALAGALSRALGDGVRIVRAPCVGACDRAPVAVVGRNRVAPASAESAVGAAVRDRIEAAIPDYQDLDAYREAGGYGGVAGLRDGKISRAAVLAALDTSGLRGLGGAGFPVGRKWRFLDGSAKPRAVVVNADEGEPGTFKDHLILTSEPHRMLEGALIAAHVVEADDVYVYLRDEYADARAILTVEIAKLQATGIAGDVRLHLRRGAGSYVCGEESALLESLEGKPGLPRNRPPYPAQHGLFGRPTLINNVETLYWVTGIVQKGGAWYADAGRPHLYSVSGRIKEPGVKLAPAGITLVELIEEHCGGMADGHTLKAFLPGGASGGILPASMANVPLDFGELEKHGAFVGSSAVVVLSEADDIRTVVGNLLDFFIHESCGQCTPCRAGCDKLKALTAAPTWDAALIHELAQTMRDGSICGLGQAAPNPVLGALAYFGDEL